MPNIYGLFGGKHKNASHLAQGQHIRSVTGNRIIDLAEAITRLRLSSGVERVFDLTWATRSG